MSSAISAPLAVVASLHRHSIAVTRDHVWRIATDGVVVTPLGDGGERRIDGTVIALAAMGEEVWALGENALLQYRADGTSVGVPLPEPIARSASVGVCRAGAPAIIVRDRIDVRVDARGIVACPTSREAVIPTPEGDVMRSGRCFVHRTARREVPLPLPGDVVAGATLTGGAALAGGAMVALLARGQNGTHLLVVDLERIMLVARLRMTGVSQIVWVEERVQAVLVRDRALTAVDLLRGRHLGTHTMHASVEDAAIDTGAHSLVAVTTSGMELIDYARLIGESARSPVTSTQPEDPPAPIAEPVAPAVVVAPVLVAPPPVRLVEPSTLAPLLGLAPRDEPPPLGEDDLRAYLEDCFAIVASWCELTAAFDERGDSPEALVAARARERAAAARLDRWRGAPTPMAVLAAEFELSPLACAILLIAAAPQLWSEIAVAYRGLADEAGCPLLDERLLGRLLEVDRAHRHELTREIDDDAPLRRHGLLELAPGPGPFVALGVPRVVLRRLTGDRFDGPHERPAVAPCTRPLFELHVPAAAIERALAELAASDAPARIVVRGRAGSGRRALAAALADRAGRKIGLVELTSSASASGLEALRRDLREVHVRGWIPCISGLDNVAAAEAAVREEVSRALELHSGPVFVRCGPDARPPVGTGQIVIDLPTLSVSERTAAWTDALAGGVESTCARQLAERYPIGAGRIFRTAADLVRGDRSVDEVVAHVDRTLAHERAERLGRVANRVDRLASWDELVLPEDVLDTVNELIARIRLRPTVLEQWGMDRISSTGRAVTALFQGGPGTGKTLVAGVIARALGFELYRVDLSRVTSKWIGETEKNLAEVFDAAEDGRCILLFDEADSLFARRTAVHNSNDRFANLEVNYLLQRLDTFEGVAILTTNFGTSIDPAFKRRLAVHLQFPFPDDSERELLWRAHLPSELPTAGDLALPQLARTYRMSGGYIRNAALRAAYLAAAETRPLSADHLRRAAIAEYRDRGNLGASGALE